MGRSEIPARSAATIDGGVQVRYSSDVRRGPHRLDVNGQLLGYLIAVVEFTWSAGCSVEPYESNVGRACIGHAGVVCTATPDEQKVRGDSEADVAQDALHQTPGSGNPARLGYDDPCTLDIFLVHVVSLTVVRADTVIASRRAANSAYSTPSAIALRAVTSAFGQLTTTTPVSLPFSSG